MVTDRRFAGVTKPAVTEDLNAKGHLHVTWLKKTRAGEPVEDLNYFCKIISSC